MNNKLSKCLGVKTLSKLLLGVSMAVCSLSVDAAATVNQDNDWQIWNSYSIDKKLTDKLTAELSTEARFGADSSRLYHQYTQLTFDYRMSDHVVVTPGIRESYDLITSSSTRDEWGHSHQLMFAVTWNWEICGIKFTDRNRLHFVHPSANQNSKNHTVYRNKIKAVMPCSWTSLNITPYVSDELFFKESEGYHKNRARFGLKADLKENLHMNFFFQWQTTQNPGSWKNLNAVGLDFSGSF